MTSGWNMDDAYIGSFISDCIISIYNIGSSFMSRTYRRHPFAIAMMVSQRTSTIGSNVKAMMTVLKVHITHTLTRSRKWHTIAVRGSIAGSTFVQWSCWTCSMRSVRRSTWQSGQGERCSDGRLQYRFVHHSTKTRTNRASCSRDSRPNDWSQHPRNGPLRS